MQCRDSDEAARSEINKVTSCCSPREFSAGDCIMKRVPSLALVDVAKD
jgi:hypothetical protein